MDKITLILLLIIPWLSYFLLNQYSRKRFMPVALLASLIVTTIFENAYIYNWWEVESTITPWGQINSVPLTFGSFFIGTIWVFHFFYDKGFWIYFMVNLIVDAGYAFGLLSMLIYLDIYQLEHVGKFGIWMMMIGIAFIIYFYQRWQDSIMKSKEA